MGTGYILASHNYKIDTRKTSAHADADSMSHLSLPQTWSPKCEKVEYFLESEVVINVPSQKMKKKPQVDPVLSHAYSYHHVLSCSYRYEFSTQKGRIQWNPYVCCCLRKQPTFGVATTGFPTKWRLRNERRNSILMTRHYPDLGSAFDWLKQISHAARPIRSTAQMWVVTRH